MSILKIVLTGGPSCGKTKSIDYLKSQFFSNLNDNDYIFKNRRIIFINETASELILNGITPRNCKKVKDFQKLVFALQQSKENQYSKIPALMPENDYVFILDRGLLDGGAYIEGNEFSDILKANGATKADVLKTYDYVLFLESDVNSYTTKDNQARMENANEAMILQEKTRRMWEKHQNLIDIPVQKTLEEKQKLVFETISSIIEQNKNAVT